MSPKPPKTQHLPPLGAHVSVAGGMPTAIERATVLGCTAAQVFVKNANQWQGRELSEAEVASFRAARAASQVGPLVAHASYLINLCSADPALLARSREALADELSRCARLGIDGLVLHPGAHLGAGEEVGIARVAESLDAVLSALPNVSTRSLGYRLEHLAAIRARVLSPHRVGVCLDTCHAFAAGYAIYKRQGYEDFVTEIEELLGLPAVGCFHLNDSVRPFGSRRDRHAHIGEGEIGLTAFARLLHDPRLRAIPMVLETEPGDEMEGHRRDLELLRSLRKPRR
ncbi:MAG TPA: deoxyribonuclease IV [Thermoanaerobaculia bacterium]|nr:deoxyribonuclease IV [Thermoanaerobaculia bacterium]